MQLDSFLERNSGYSNVVERFLRASRMNGNSNGLFLLKKMLIIQQV